MSFLSQMKYTIGPVSLLTCLPSVLIILLLIFSSTSFSENYQNLTSSLTFVILFNLYCFVFLKFCPQSSTTKGDVNIDLTQPVYPKNGLLFWGFTIVLQIVIGQYFAFDRFLLDNQLMIGIIFIIEAYIFSLIIFIQGKIKFNQLKLQNQFSALLEEPEESNGFYQYFRGMEFHPDWFGVDIKQFAISRFGMQIWQILILSFAIASYQQYGWNWGIFTNIGLQTIYIAKFFYWEIGYFYTIDIVKDRAGFYLCGGSIVFIPCFYTLPTFIMCNYPPQISQFMSLMWFALGILFLVLNYWVDLQKQEFQQSQKKQDVKCTIFGKPAEYLDVKKFENGEWKNGKLLLSGFWGWSRHMNYTFELLVAFSWSIVGFNSHWATILYFLYLTSLFIQRVYRDEARCEIKYGKYWELYCQKVKYKLVPGVF